MEIFRFAHPAVSVGVVPSTQPSWCPKVVWRLIFIPSSFVNPAVSVGVGFSAVIVVLQFCHAWQAATVVAAILCFFAALVAFRNFGAGGWVDGCGAGWIA